MTTHIFNVTRLTRLTGSGVPLFASVTSQRGFSLADNSIIHHSYRNGVDSHKKQSQMKKIKAKSRKAAPNAIDWERVKIKAYLYPISRSDLRDSLVATLQARGEKVLLITP